MNEILRTQMQPVQLSFTAKLSQCLKYLKSMAEVTLCTSSSQVNSL